MSNILSGNSNIDHHEQIKLNEGFHELGMRGFYRMIKRCNVGGRKAINIGNGLEIMKK